MSVKVTETQVLIIGGGIIGAAIARELSKFKTRTGMGRCQGGFCTSRVLKIMSEELGISPLEIK